MQSFYRPLPWKVALVVAMVCWSLLTETPQAFVTLSSPLVRPVCVTTTFRNNKESSSFTALWISKKDRENEIRRKIARLKKQGKIKKTADDKILDDDERGTMKRPSNKDLSDEYGDRIRQKLGDTKSKLLGFSGEDIDDSEEDELDDQLDEEADVRRAQIGALPVQPEEEEQVSFQDSFTESRESTGSSQKIRIDPSLFGDDDEEPEMEEEDLVDLVAQKMAEKRYREAREKEERIKQEARARLEALEEQRKAEEAAVRQQEQLSATATSVKQTGIGGSWDKNTTAKDELYQPKTGSWGAFPRPKDISKAYGGGRRVGPGYSNEQARAKSAEDTREKLRAYREKVGIDVQSEKEHATEIDEALKIASYAMQRGVYNSAVKALESVTKWCSTNSRIGGKVFLELAMAYEAVGRTEEAITVYRTLTKCRIEEIKFDAKRLLYGIEAMQFMRNDVKSSEFSRKKAKNTFIDTTGLANIAQNFDDVYETAYIDMEGSFYKRLTESVVRSSREARQILLRATDAGEVQRPRIVQALRSISRRFDDALDEELARSRPIQEPVAVMNGKPIVRTPVTETAERSTVAGMDEFVLTEADQMSENLNGEWRLQLIADRRGDGVKYFNSTISWQRVDMDRQTFASTSPSGFLTIQQTGGIEFNKKRRIIRRKSVQTSGGGMLTGLFGTTTGAVGVVNKPQQVMTVDSILLVTRGVSSQRSKSSKDDEKDFFAVWRRVEPGTYSDRS